MERLTASARRRPHVFLVLIDTLRADHLGVYGYPLPTSPHLDAFATEAAVYGRAFAPAPWTRPSCGTLLTSRHPPELGIREQFDALPEEIPLLPQFLRREGYRTAGILASVQVSAQFGFAKGFDRFDSGTAYLPWTGAQQALSRLGLVDYRDVYPRYNARQITDRATHWIEEQRQAGDRPLFLYLHYADPHAPYRPPPEEDRWREFAGEEARLLAEPPFSPTRHGELSGVRADALVARYDAEIAYLDHHLHRLFLYLKEEGLYDESLIIVTSDHGEEFADHGGWAHFHTLYNELLHVPLIIKYPSFLADANRQRIESVTGLIDVVPTIRDVLAAHWSAAGFRGRSLLRPELERDDYAVFARNRFPSLRALVRSTDKLIQEVDPEGGVVTEKFFALESDFGELSDGALPEPSFPDRRARIDEMRKILAAIDAIAMPSREIELDPATLRELKALGYID
jgi:arylsulfatase A-like enzyme